MHDEHQSAIRAKHPARRPFFIVSVLCLTGNLATTKDTTDRAIAMTPTAPQAPMVTVGSALRVDAMASCRRVETSLGIRARAGIAAADVDVLPLGSVVRITRTERHNGIYTVMDDRPSLDGPAIDFYVRDCEEATRFGVREIRLEILRVGWVPMSTDPES